jgi:hypothetical protein
LIEHHQQIEVYFSEIHGKNNIHEMNTVYMIQRIYL